MQEEIEEGRFDPAEEKARAEEIEALLAQRREVLSRRTRSSTDDKGDDDENESGDGAGKGHAKDIGDQEPLYLGIGTSSKHAFYMDDDDDDIVADSPSAVDYNIYDRAYEQAIKDKMDENPGARPIMYLTKFVMEKDYFKAFENIVENTIFSPAAVKEQMRETREHLYEHFTSPSTTKLASLVAKIGLSDPPHAAKPTELGDGEISTLATEHKTASPAEGATPTNEKPEPEPSTEKTVEESTKTEDTPKEDTPKEEAATPDVGQQLMQHAISAFTSAKKTWNQGTK